MVGLGLGDEVVGVRVTGVAGGGRKFRGLLLLLLMLLNVRLTWRGS